MIPPLLLNPVFRHRVWGGDRLGKWLAAGDPPAIAYKHAQARGSIGEAWLLADLPPTILDGKSRIAAGPHEGNCLSDLLSAPPLKRNLMGHAKTGSAGDGYFPLLVKLLDAAENLSVQVHPDAAYAHRNPDTHMKSEMWLVLDAEPGAVIYRGIDPSIDRDALRRKILDDTLLDAMIKVPARVGDCFWLPSGICHALGAGTLVAEVQTPSDTTFRVWDWGRNDPARPLHIEQAIECILLGDEQQIDLLDAPPHHPALAGERIAITGLVRTDYFDVERWSVRAGTTIEHGTAGVPISWTVLDGEVRIPTLAQPLRAGGTIVIPAESPPWEAIAGSQGVQLLVTMLPAPDLMQRSHGGLRLA
ncbi:MAG: hypothetical protein FJ285_05795 [Planctomycetes bacterium]|nr:hypothetical protein [Planctomycetota bacterium]